MRLQDNRRNSEDIEKTKAFESSLSKLEQIQKIPKKIGFACERALAGLQAGWLAGRLHVCALCARSQAGRAGNFETKFYKMKARAFFTSNAQTFW